MLKKKQSEYEEANRPESPGNKNTQSAQHSRRYRMDDYYWLKERENEVIINT